MNIRRMLIVVLLLTFVGALSFGALSAQDPTQEPTIEPTIVDTLDPTEVDPTLERTLDPTIEATLTAEPTVEGTVEPTLEGTVEPTLEGTVEPTTEATVEDEATATATEATTGGGAVVQQEEDCDADLVLALYIAQHFFEYDSFRDMTEDTAVDIDALDKGQYSALFTTMMMPTPTDPMITVEISATARERISEIMAMDDADFDVYLDNIMMANATDMGDFTVLIVRTFGNEADDCAALRDDLRRFYLALAIVDTGLHDMDMMEMDTTDTTETTDTTDDASDDATTNADNDLAEGAIVVNMSGAEEVPGPGDEDGAGRAVVYLRTESNEVCVDITVEEITLPTAAAHIHEGAAGESGPPVIDLNAPGENGVSNTCVTVEAEMMEALANNPQNYYVNVHTSDFPDGALRGQLN